jgi:hypothetical protein
MTAFGADDQLEPRLAAAFRRGSLPAAPYALSAALERAVDAPVATRRRGTRRSAWPLVGIAALLAVGGIVALFGGGGAPSFPAPSTRPSIATEIRLTFAIQWTEATPASDEVRTQLATTVERRLAGGLGLGASVMSDGADRLLVDLPAEADTDLVRAFIARRGLVAIVPLGQTTLSAGDRVDPVRFPPLIEADGIQSAMLTKDQTGQPALRIDLTSAATGPFAEYTRIHVGDFAAITVDDVAISVPRINSQIEGGSIEITSGDSDAAEFGELAALIAAGPLPVGIVQVGADVTATPPPAIGPTPSTIPQASTPAPSLVSVLPPNLECAPRIETTNPQMSCEAAVTEVLAILPDGIEPVGRIRFQHACVDPTGRAAIDCAVEAYGLVSMELSNGEHLVAQVSLGQPGVQIVAPLRGDDADQLTLPSANPLACAVGRAPVEAILRIEPARLPPIRLDGGGAIGAAGDIIGLARPFPMLLTGDRGGRSVAARVFLARDGTTLRPGDAALLAVPGVSLCEDGTGGLILALVDG